MTQAHWMFLGLVSLFLLILLGVSLASQPTKRWYRWTRRIFWSAVMLLFGEWVSRVGLNLFNLVATVFLGAPGFVALAVLSGM